MFRRMWVYNNRIEIVYTLKLTTLRWMLFWKRICHNIDIIKLDFVLQPDRQRTPRV